MWFPPSPPHITASRPWGTLFRFNEGWLRMLTPFCTLMALHSLLSYIANPNPTLRVVMAVFHQQVRKSPAYARELIVYGSVKKKNNNCCKVCCNLCRCFSIISEGLSGIRWYANGTNHKSTASKEQNTFNFFLLLWSVKYFMLQKTQRQLLYNQQKYITVLDTIVHITHLSWQKIKSCCFPIFAHGSIYHSSMIHVDSLKAVCTGNCIFVPFSWTWLN